MRRREFIAALGGAAAAWPLTARAQQAAMPQVGLLDPRSPEGMTERLRAFRQGLKETGYVEGETVGVEYPWAENQMDRLPGLAAGLVRQSVAVIVTPGGVASALAAKASTTIIPIVFVVGEDPVARGLVASLARPDGNLTGVNFLSTELTAKRLELLSSLVPGAARVAVLINRANETNAETTLRDIEPAARTMGLQIEILNASNNREIDAAFDILARNRPDALFVGLDPFFNSRRIQIVHLASHHRMPAIYGNRDFVEAGGLMSYASSIADAYHQAGIYTGRILKGAKPVDLPIVQARKLDLVISLRTARLLGLTVPPTLLARADEVIE
jgi:putative ABC transport system substrate-binding protein